MPTRNHYLEITNWQVVFNLSMVVALYVVCVKEVINFSKRKWKQLATGCQRLDLIRLIRSRGLSILRNELERLFWSFKLSAENKSFPRMRSVSWNLGEKLNVKWQKLRTASLLKNCFSEKNCLITFRPDNIEKLGKYISFSYLKNLSLKNSNRKEKGLVALNISDVKSSTCMGHSKI